MTNSQENKVSMYAVVLSKCRKFKDVWGELPAFANAYHEFDAIFQEIRQAGEIQLMNITGITEGKLRHKNDMIEVTLKVASSMFAYASTEQNYELKASVKYSARTLKRMRDTELKNLCTMILKTADEIIDRLADYGTTVVDLQELKKEIADYENVMAEPREALTNRAVATAKLETLFAQADKVLKEQMDKLMLIFKKSNDVFYGEYFNARKIIDLGVRHKKIVDS